MDLGLGNLKELKQQLLAAALVPQTTYDLAITAIGKGVAAQFDRHCNRNFGRVVGAQEVFSADRMGFILGRYPVEAITTVEIRDDVPSGWVVQNQNDIIINREDEKGLLQFGFVVGLNFMKLRVTYTGGYWYDTTEDGSGVMPGTATLLPQDVKLAWYLQCQEVWNHKDKLGIGITDKPTNPVKLDGLSLIPQVVDILRQCKRYQMT